MFDICYILIYHITRLIIRNENAATIIKTLSFQYCQKYIFKLSLNIHFL